MTTLKLQLTVREHGWIVRKQTDNLDAYDLVLRGLESASRYTKETNAQARQMYEKAIALDPQYAEAYVRLGMSYWLEWRFQWSRDPQKLERMFALGQQALALDDSLPGAHSLLSRVYTEKQQYDQALVEGERAITLDPNDADSYAYQADGLNHAGRPEEALRMVEQALRLNPRYPSWYLIELGFAYRWTGRYAEAIATLKELINQSPNFLHGHFLLAFSYVQQWDYQQSMDARTLVQALAAAHRSIALNDSAPTGHRALGTVYLWQKQYEQAIAAMERVLALDPHLANGYATLAETLSRVATLDQVKNDGA